MIFDPSSFFGHSEAECVNITLVEKRKKKYTISLSLAIARIFGGFPQSFFSKYHELLPISEPQDQYDLRVALYELFHYLNHAFIFGGVSLSLQHLTIDAVESVLELTCCATIHRVGMHQVLCKGWIDSSANARSSVVISFLVCKGFCT